MLALLYLQDPLCYISCCVAGGAVLEDGDGIDLVQCYNPRTDMWIDRPNMQIARSGSASCVLDGLIYVIGRLGAWKHNQITCSLIS